MRKAYPKYKPSGVEWLGDVPEHWQLKKLKFAFHILNGSTPESSKEEYWDGDIVWYTPEDLGINANKYISDSRRKITREGYDSIGAKIAPPDSIIISTRAPIGHLSITSTPSCTNQGCRSLVPKASISSAYYYYYLLITKINLNAIGKGTTFIELGTQGLGTYNIPVPPLPEQQAIATFLDRETVRIDTLIAKKQRLLELLTEQRTALISRAVTKGLDSSVKLKPSGVEWLGDVPEHWVVKALRYVSLIETGDKDTIDAEEDGEYPFFVRSQTVERINSYTKNCEGVLTAGDGVGVGKVFHYVNGKFDFHQRVYLFSNFRNVTGRYFFLFLKENFWRVALEGGAKSTVDSLRRPMIASFPFGIPPLSDQQAITDFLDRETAKIDALSAKVTTVIERLKEYRTALISSAVTGKIDVSDTLNINVQEAV